jgi:hypothetical protein
MCQLLKDLPRNLISSGGILGCGWLRLMPSNKACGGGGGEGGVGNATWGVGRG